jgi:hypothetical protein
MPNCLFDLYLKARRIFPTPAAIQHRKITNGRLVLLSHAREKFPARRAPPSPPSRPVSESQKKR